MSDLGDTAVWGDAEHEDEKPGHTRIWWFTGPEFDQAWSADHTGWPYYLTASMRARAAWQIQSTEAIEVIRLGFVHRVLIHRHIDWQVVEDTLRYTFPVGPKDCQISADIPGTAMGIALLPTHAIVVNTWPGVVMTLEGDLLPKRTS